MRRQTGLITGLALLLAALFVPLAAQAATTLTRTSSFDYDSTGVLTKEVVEPGSSTLCVVTVYGLDGYGNRKTTTTRNCNGSAGSYSGTVTEAVAPTGTNAAAAFPERAASAVYSTDQRFVATAINALNHSESREYDAYGRLKKLTGPNGLATEWAYDGLGRKVLEKRADGTGTQWRYDFCSDTAGGSLACPSIAGSAGAYALTATPVKAPIDLVALTTGAADGPYMRVYYNGLGHEIRSETQDDTSGTTRLVFQDTEYNGRGQVSRKSRPYYSGDTAYWSVYTYDLLGRVLTENRPTESADSGAITTTTYNGLMVSVQDALGRTTSQSRNVAGQVETITDALGQTLTRQYDPLGNLVQTRDALGNVTSLVYDLKGRKTQLYDPDLGVWSYQYNALGELTAQTDANALVTTMVYDQLGRMTRRTVPARTQAGTAVPGLTSTWSYDKFADATACAKGIGKLCEASGDNGYRRKNAFDSLGRLASATTTVNAATYTASLAYTAEGRVQTQTYPTGLSLGSAYTPLGLLKTLKDNRVGGLTLWTANSRDAEGHLTQYTYGNSVVNTEGYNPRTGRLTTAVAGVGTATAVQNLVHTYDGVGNLKTRLDVLTGVTASYAYDTINRLDTETRSGGGVGTAQVIDWDYDAIGNITQRKDGAVAGVYHYNGSGVGSLRPHAVANVTGTLNGVVNPLYTYDANGSLTSSAGRSVIWYGFNKVWSITTPGTSPKRLAWLYDADQERALENYTLNGVLQRTTVYLNPAAGAGLYFEHESGLAGTKKKHYLSAGGATIGMIVCTLEPCTTLANTSTQYWHKDHLGSVSVATNAAGAVLERMAYEPFGKRRASNGVTDAAGTLTPLATDRGYTEHEHIDELGLINMNGRIYDPALSRFLSADPNVTYPRDLQSFNRYSYTLNNPLRFTDPTGFDPSYDSDDGSGSAISGNYEYTTLGRTGSPPQTVKSSQTPTTPTEAASKATSTTSLFGWISSLWSDAANFAKGHGVATGWTSILDVPTQTAAENAFANGYEFGSFARRSLGLFQALTLSEGDVLPGLPGAAAGIGALWRLGPVADGAAVKSIGPTVGELRAVGLKDAHHIIQDAAVRNLKGYGRNAAPGVVLEGPSNVPGTAHNLATAVQREAGGGTFAAERRIGYKALRSGGLSADEARSAIGRADSYFESIGVTRDTITRIPGNRR